MRCLLVIVVVLVFSCNNKKEERHRNTPNYQMFCDENFEVFFKKFVNDSLYQKDHIMFPLKLSYYESTSGRDIYVVEELVNERNIGSMFVVPQKEVRGLQFDYEEEKFEGNDTVNYSFKRKRFKRAVVYTFVQKNDCWQLHKIFDDSIYQPDPFRQSKLKQFTNPLKIQ